MANTSMACQQIYFVKVAQSAIGMSPLEICQAPRQPIRLATFLPIITQISILHDNAVAWTYFRYYLAFLESTGYRSFVPTKDE